MTRRCSQDRWGIEHLFLGLLALVAIREMGSVAMDFVGMALALLIFTTGIF